VICAASATAPDRDACRRFRRAQSSAMRATRRIPLPLSRRREALCSSAATRKRRPASDWIRPAGCDLSVFASQRRSWPVCWRALRWRWRSGLSHSPGAGGSITPARVDEIWRIAEGHGIGLPPLFNLEGLVSVREWHRNFTDERWTTGPSRTPELLFGMSWEDPESDRQALQSGQAMRLSPSVRADAIRSVCSSKIQGAFLRVDINPCQSASAGV